MMQKFISLKEQDTQDLVCLNFEQTLLNHIESHFFFLSSERFYGVFIDLSGLLTSTSTPCVFNIFIPLGYISLGLPRLHYYNR